MAETATARDPLENARDEIFHLIQNGELDRALKRLLDFARDFSLGRTLEREAVVLSHRHSQYRTEVRRSGATAETDARNAELVSSVLELADKIYEGNHRPPAAPSGMEYRSGLREEPAPPPVPPPANDDQREVTALEQARQRFRKPQDAPAAFRCRGMGRSYGKGFSLEGIDLELRPGQITGLIGVNGSGKTTLLRVIAGELAATRGELAYPTLSPKGLDWPVIRSKIGYVSQESSPWPGRVAQMLHVHAAFHGFIGQDNIHEVEFMLHRLGLEHYRNHSWEQLSGGFRMRCELARVLIADSELLVLAEPLAPLDIITQTHFIQDLRDLSRSSRRPLSVIVSSQHIYEIERISDPILFLHDGRALFNGPLDRLASDRTENVFEIACDLSIADFQTHMSTAANVSVEDSCGVLLVRTTRTTSGTQLLTNLLEAGVEISLYRDASHSTREFFEQAVKK